MNVLIRSAHTAGLAVACAVLLNAQAPVGPPQAPQSPQAPGAVTPVPSLPDQPLLVPNVHSALPLNVDDYWFAPRDGEHPTEQDRVMASASGAFAAGNFASASSYAQKAAALGGPLTGYARYYIAVSDLRMSRADEAVKAFDAVLDGKPDGQLAVSAMLGKADALELRGDHAGAADLLEKVSSEKTATPDNVLLRFAQAALNAGDRPRAAAAFLKIYYEFPLTDAATSAGAALASLQDVVSKTGYKLDLGRALVLFGAKRYAEARSALDDIHDTTSGDDREVVDLRMAECDYFLKHFPAARDRLEPYVEHASRQAEAQFFYLGSIRELGDTDRYVSLTHALVDQFPDSTWAEEALNNLGTYYILANQDDQAAQTFKEMYEKFPHGLHAERAAWKYGWWAYRTSNFAETIRVFESAAVNFPHSDYRPPYLYWSARARERMGDKDAAQVRLRLVYTDYRNSYYGRLAHKRLTTVAETAAPDTPDPAADPSPEVVPVAAQMAPAPAPAAAPPTAPLIRILLRAGLYDDAMGELTYAQAAWGTSPAIQATMAWIYHQKGDLRRAITIMRHAYPEFLAAGGEDLPPQILQVIFPLTYWDSIKKYATARELDPYVMAALIAQESTFDPGAHSVADAWGLMQIEPSTGRKLARVLHLRYRLSMLTNADINLRMGMLYFSQLVERFGGTYYALASYDAGDTRVVKWKLERPGLEEDEFIDDIPFPETQNYVKRILGTAEDYRRLYGEDGATAAAVHAVSKHPVHKVLVRHGSSSARGTVAHASATHTSTSRRATAHRTSTVHKTSTSVHKTTATRRPTTHKTIKKKTAPQESSR